MPSIEREQENTPQIINFFTQRYGINTTGTPVQVFPLSGREDVTSGVGHFSTGSYYAYDNTEVEGWTPGPAVPTGSYIIRWYVKFTATSPEQQFQEEFIVLVQGSGTFGNGYLTIAELRAAGIDETTLSDVEAAAKIELWSKYIDEATGQFFDQRYFTLYFDGMNADTFFLPFPIIEVEEFKINDSENALDSSEYVVYNRYYPDDRRNPKISLKSSQTRNIYDPSYVFDGPLLLHGMLNCSIKGKFGFVEADGSTPALIKRAVLKLISLDLTPVTTPGGTEPAITGSLIEERTVDHWYRLGGTTQAPNGYTWTASGDREIDMIIKMYRAPIKLGTTVENVAIRYEY